MSLHRPVVSAGSRHAPRPLLLLLAGLLAGVLACGGGGGSAEEDVGPDEGPPDGPPGAVTLEVCDDGADDDGDGATDCADEACAEFPACVTPPPEPSASAPPWDPTDGAAFAEGIRFLYEGDDAVIRGLDPAALEPERVAVVRGRVLGVDGEPLPGVRASCPGRPEMGHTFSRGGGDVDLVVNGDEPVTVRFEADGHLPVDRTRTPEGRDFTTYPDIVLTPLDQARTELDGTDGGVAVATTQADSDGERTARAWFAPGTQATLTLPDGSTQILDTFTVRATEFTVGDLGEQAMPAELPEDTAYTYAVELSLDEALAVGAESVSFSAPVAVYLDNFLGFDVGTAVPSGVYDRSSQAWEASQDGRVLQVVSVTDGRAELDLDGDGEAEGDSELAAAGIPDAERVAMASQLSAGDEVWRVAVTHFSPWDFNWPFDLPDDATEPDGEFPENPDPCGRRGSIVECESQVLMEQVSLPGVPTPLVYRSDRTFAGSGRTFEWPLTGDDPPASLVKVGIEIQVAGQRAGEEYPPDANLTHTFTWDGLDAYGRRLYGLVPVRVAVSYFYEVDYAAPLAGADASFGAAGGEVLQDGRVLFPVRRTFRGEIGGLDARDTLALGGWMLDGHHFYGADAQALFTAGHREREAPSTGVAGEEGGEVLTFQAFSGDLAHLPLDPRQLDLFADIAAAPDGSVYFRTVSPTGGSVVLRLLQDGSVEHFLGRVFATDQEAQESGCLQSTGCGLGGPATEAVVPMDNVAVDSQGRVFVSNLGGCVHVVEDGVVEVYAGQCLLDAPTGFDPIQALAIAPDDTVWVANEGRIQRVTEGEVDFTPVYGDPLAGEANGDGGPASEAGLSVGQTGMVFDEDGSLYFYEQRQETVRRITPDGTIDAFYVLDGFGVESLAPAPGGGVIVAEVMGTYDVLTQVDDAGPRVIAGASDAELAAAGIMPRDTRSEDVLPADGIFLTFVNSMALGPDGALYFTDVRLLEDIHLYNFVRVLPGVATEADLGLDSFVTSADGTLAYRFAPSGRHLASYDTLTGEAVRTFAYDAEGRLASVTDGQGRVTTLERDTAGGLSAIVGPGGHRTEVTLDEGGYVDSFTTPAGRTASATYGPGGLLLALTDFAGSTTEYTWDAAGRLTGTLDADGGGLSLVRTTGGVEVTTASGDTTLYAPGGTVSDGVTATRVEEDGLTVVTAPDGTVTTSRVVDDPRLAGQAGFLGERSTAVPSGSVQVVTQSVEAEAADDEAPLPEGLAVGALTWTRTVDGRTYTDAWDPEAATWTYTTPEGRTYVHAFDAEGRLARAEIPGFVPLEVTWDEEGRVASAGQGDRTLTYGYGAHAGPETVTDPLGRTTTWGRDADGRVDRITFADGRTLEATLDGMGRMTALTTPSGDVHAYTFDAAGRVTSWTPPAPADPVAFEYDADHALSRVLFADQTGYDLERDDLGRPATLSTPEGAHTAAYDEATGQPTAWTSPDGALGFTWDGFLLAAQTFDFGPAAHTVSRRFDDSFRVVERTVDDGHAVSFAYDDDGLPVSAGAMSLTWHPAAFAPAGTAVGAVTTEQTWDAFGQLESVTASVDGAPVYAYAFERDAAGRIVAVDEVVEGAAATRAPTFDGGGRLTAVDEDGTTAEAYAFDDDGNATSIRGVEAAYDAADRIVSFGDATFTHDVTGAVATRTDATGVTTWDHDVLGRLRSVTLPDGAVIGYLYDTLGRRVGRTVDGAWDRGWVYDDFERPVAELDASGAVAARFVYALRSNVPDLMIRDGVTYRLLYDHLGSPRLVVDTQTGAVVQRLDYDAFGRIIQDTAPGFQPFGFAGGVVDPDTGLVSMGRRDYDPELIRFLSRDPHGTGGGHWNPYVYARNDPVHYLDATGLDVLQALDDIVMGDVEDEARLGGREAWARLNGHGPHMGPVGALRHCNMNCRMTRRFGVQTARLASWFHEVPEPMLKGKFDNLPGTPDRDMDEWNNDCGQDYADRDPNEDCIEACAKGLSRGELKVPEPGWPEERIRDLVNDPDKFTREERHRRRTDPNRWR
ncbi:MAG: RHS repeat-associated core domain-containing protein [Myxococcota bacterium]